MNAVPVPRETPSPLPSPGGRGRLHEPPARGRYGNALFMRRDPLHALLDWQATYGGIVRVNFRRWTHILYEPEDIKHVLVAHQGRYHKGENLKVAKSVFGKGLLTSEEPLHLVQRHLMQPAFHREVLRSYAQEMSRRSDRLAREWLRPQEVNVHAAMMRLTLDIAAKTMFGMDDVAGALSLSHAIDEAQEVFRARTMALWAPPEWVPTPKNLRGWKALEVMDGVILRMIRERQASTAEGRDLLSLLLQARDEGGKGMDDAQLRDEALTLLLAGHETTASGLSWALFLLAQHPEVQERAAGEVGRVVGDRLPTIDDVPNLQVLDRVFAEAIRLYPPAWVFTRYAVEADELEGGVRIPAGEEVMVSPWAVHRNPRFFPDPLRFDPDRFLPEARSQRPDFAYFPFGGGTRRCIGEPFAKLEAVLVLASLLGRTRFALGGRGEPEPEPLFTLRPRNGVWLKIAPRAS